VDHELTPKKKKKKKKKKPKKKFGKKTKNPKTGQGINPDQKGEGETK
jgi:hypothetical protein